MRPVCVINDENWQLWDFINKEAALYRIEKSRGADIVQDTNSVKNMVDFLALISILLTIALRQPVNRNVSFIS